MLRHWLRTLFQGPSSSRPSTPKRLRLGLEELERRELMAAQLTATLSPDGLLRVEGTDYADTIHGVKNF